MFHRPVLLLVAVPAAALLVVVLTAARAAPAGKAAVPQRIISLSPTATESLYAIGAGKQVVAVDNQSDYPKRAPHTKLSGYTPNIEAIAAYKPDLVVIAYDPNHLRATLTKLGIRVLEQDAPENLDGAYAQIQQLGRVTGHAARANRLVASMRKRIGTLVTAGRKLGAGLTVYHELDPTFYSVTSNTFIGRIYALFGLKNIADAADKTGSGYPQLSAEYVVEQSPDLIVLADTVCCGQSPKTVAARPGWSSIRAVRTGEIVRLDDSIASRWGPRVVNFVRAVASALSHLRS